MNCRFFISIFIDKDKAESLKKIRIIRQNLILFNTTLLQSTEYFLQYGTIKNIILSKK